MPAVRRASSISGQISRWRRTYSSSYPGLGYAEDSNQPRFDAELDGDAVAGFAVVDPEPPQGRFAGADGDVSRSVVAHEDEAIVEIHRVELRERPARSQR